MNNFTYISSGTVDAALAQIGQMPNDRATRGLGMFIAGGTNLIDLMKAKVMRPARLVDINPRALGAIEALPDGGLCLGALARNADTAYHPLVARQYPLLSAAILAGHWRTGAPACDSGYEQPLHRHPSVRHVRRPAGARCGSSGAVAAR